MSQVVWEQGRDAYSAHVRATDGAVRYRMITERNPDGSWYWAVWALRGSFDASGQSLTSQTAMLHAEQSIPAGN
jgi:hypothetical protein